MKYLLIIAVLISTSSVFSQNKFHFGLQTNGNFTTGLPSSTNWPSDNYKGLETFSFCYSGGVTVDFDLTDKLSLQSGLLFRKSGDRSKFAFSDSFITQVNGVPRGNYRLKFKYFGAELPINVYYTLTNKFKIGTGGSLVYYSKAFSQNIYRHPPKSGPTPIYIHKKFNFLVNLHLHYGLSDHFYFEAQSQYSITETFAADFNNLDTPRNYLSLGIALGYNFN